MIKKQDFCITKHKVMTVEYDTETAGVRITQTYVDNEIPEGAKEFSSPGAAIVMGFLFSEFNSALSFLGDCITEENERTEKLLTEMQEE